MKALAKLIAFLPVAVVMGCTITPQRAAETDIRQLCIWYMSPFIGDSDKTTVYRELSSRSVPIERDCAVYWEQNMQLFSLGVQMMQQSRPQPAPTSYTDCYKTAYGYRCEHQGQTYYDCYPTGSGYRCQ